MMKNIFYFTLKSFFVVNILKFCLDFFGHIEKRLYLKKNLISNFMTSQPGKKKQLQYTYSRAICQQVKAIKQCNLFIY